MLGIAAIHINTEEPQRLGDFYQQVLGTEPAWASDEVIGFFVGDVRLEVAKHDQVSGKNSEPARIFFNFLVKDVRTEFERIVALGADVIQEPYDFSDGDMQLAFATLADPDGNYFQLVSID